MYSTSPAQLSSTDIQILLRKQNAQNAHLLTTIAMITAKKSQEFDANEQRKIFNFLYQYTHYTSRCEV